MKLIFAAFLILRSYIAPALKIIDFEIYFTIFHVAD